jgi:DNA-binding beta-propeller fold protein YncE
MASAARDLRLPISLLAVGVLLGGCGKKDTLRTLDRVALRDTVAAEATLAVDSAGRAWIGQPGALAAVDTAGRQVARIPLTLTGTPRLLWSAEGRAYVRADGASAVVDATGKALGVRRSDAPLARDPRGRWVYTATRNGSVLGLAPESLVPRWGWPDAGSPVSALAVSPLGDRVYVALAGSDRHDVPAGIEVRDALSGRLLSTYPTGAAVRDLEVAPDGTLYALVGSSVAALRHGSDGLKQVWSKDFGGLGRHAPDAVRVSPNGARLAVVAFGHELHLLAAADGKVLEESKRAPRDAGWDVAGRLWVLGGREIRIVR